MPSPSSPSPSAPAPPSPPQQGSSDSTVTNASILLLLFHLILASIPSPSACSSTPSALPSPPPGMAPPDLPAEVCLPQRSYTWPGSLSPNSSATPTPIGCVPSYAASTTVFRRHEGASPSAFPPASESSPTTPPSGTVVLADRLSPPSSSTSSTFAEASTPSPYRRSDFSFLSPPHSALSRDEAAVTRGAETPETYDEFLTEDDVDRDHEAYIRARMLRRSTTRSTNTADQCSEEKEKDVAEAVGEVDDVLPQTQQSLATAASTESTRLSLPDAAAESAIPLACIISAKQGQAEESMTSSIPSVQLCPTCRRPLSTSFSSLIIAPCPAPTRLTPSPPPRLAGPALGGSGEKMTGPTSPHAESASDEGAAFEFGHSAAAPSAPALALGRRRLAEDFEQAADGRVHSVGALPGLPCILLTVAASPSSPRQTSSTPSTKRAAASLDAADEAEDRKRQRTRF